MKAIINANPEKIFKSVNAQNLYKNIIKNDHIYEHGIDTDGQIYFAYLNGLVTRQSRASFLRDSNVWAAEKLTDEI